MPGDLRLLIELVSLVPDATIAIFVPEGPCAGRIRLLVLRKEQKVYGPLSSFHAPRTMVEQERKRSFRETLQTGIGDGYAIPKGICDELIFGSDAVVLLAKVDKRRAEGTLEKLVENGETERHMKRYDVHIDGLKEVEYKPERLRRKGVAVIR